MSEFSTTQEAPEASVAMPPPSQPARHWQRPMIAGLSWPWLIGVVLIVGLAGWYLFGPDQAPSVNQLAFQEDIDSPAAHTDRATIKTVMASPSETGLGQLQSEIAAMLSGVHGYPPTPTFRKSIDEDEYHAGESSRCCCICCLWLCQRREYC